MHATHKRSREKNGPTFKTTESIADTGAPFFLAAIGMNTTLPLLKSSRLLRRHILKTHRGLCTESNPQSTPPPPPKIKKHKVAIVADQTRKSNERGLESKNIDDAELDTVFGDESDAVEDNSGSGGYLSEDSSCPSLDENGTEIDQEDMDVDNGGTGD
ncbi:hypothetical protein F3Y22_tig00111151pilonHSYRG00183 [Hibiscus syriacus]|uniref:Uncharacterized protein n=1 Tax=Hibiscus syriacus TaxID=106335 RepID=A0A6A2YXW5_HIBSY|nr:hypothetical protein F3Y22_tig00111151pilonHSYRG00183 [Hibiscus syriacus]